MITVKDQSRDLVVIQHAIDTLDRPVPEWLDVDHEQRRVMVATSQPRSDRHRRPGAADRRALLSENPQC